MSGYALEAAGDQFAEFRRPWRGWRRGRRGRRRRVTGRAGAGGRGPGPGGAAAAAAGAPGCADGAGGAAGGGPGRRGRPDAGGTRSRPEPGHGAREGEEPDRHRSGRRGVPNVDLLDEQLSLPPESSRPGCRRLALAAGRMSIQAASGRRSAKPGCGSAPGRRRGSSAPPPLTRPASPAAAACRRRRGPAGAGAGGHGKGIKMRPDSLRPAAARAAAAAVPRQAGRLSQGEVSTHKRMAEQARSSTASLSPGPPRTPRRCRRGTPGTGPRRHPRGREQVPDRERGQQHRRGHRRCLRRGRPPRPARPRAERGHGRNLATVLGKVKGMPDRLPQRPAGRTECAPAG